ncbi:MAG: hypothetical protein AB7O62_11380 [Pirellulales bacterium]
MLDPRIPAALADAETRLRLQAVLADAGHRVKLSAGYGPLRGSETLNGQLLWGEQTTLCQTLGGRWLLLTESESPDDPPSFRAVEPTEAACWLLDAATVLPDELRWVASLANPPADLAGTLKYCRDWRPDLLGPVKPKAKRPRRAPRGERQPKPLTKLQLEAFQAVQDCEGSIAKAARQLGRDRKTVDQHFTEANRKLGKAIVAKPTTTQLRDDRRGQADVCKDDDKRA